MRAALAVAVPFLLSASPWAQAETPAERPNLVLFLVDDLGWTDASFRGSGFYETPSFDELARDGMEFTDAYSNGPNCAPSRACILSGQWTPRHGVYTVGSSKRGKSANRKLIPVENTQALAERFVTLAEALGEAGYATASIGKWHLGPDPRAQGFDVNVAGNETGAPKGGYFSPYKNPELADGPDGEYLTDRLTDEAIAFLRAERERPFFLYLTHYAVHTPIQAPDALAAKYGEKPPAGGHSNARYAAMIESVDASLGRVRAALEELGLAENTVVCLFSDNGGHGNVTSMTPLRGAKGMLYEGGIRVPMVVCWPGRAPPGSRTPVPVSGLDFYPTFLELAGVPQPDGTVLDGASLVPLLDGSGALERKALYWHFPAYLQSTGASEGPWRTTPAGAVRAGRYKLIEFFEDGRRELYDLRDDVGETTDLAERMPDKARELAELLESWREEVGAPVPAELNPDYRP